MSFSRTGAPLRYATMSSRNAVGVEELAGGLDRERLAAARSSVPVGRLTLLRAMACSHFVDADAAGGERVRIDLHAHGVLLRAEDAAPARRR